MIALKDICNCVLFKKEKAIRKRTNKRTRLKSGTAHYENEAVDSSVKKVMLSICKILQTLHIFHSTKVAGYRSKQVNSYLLYTCSEHVTNHHIIFFIVT